MASHRLVTAALAGWLLATGLAWGDEVRYYEQDGVTYRETRRTVEQQVPASRMEERTETVYREQFTTEWQDTVRTCWSPVTEYRWEAFWVDRWNPFAQPSLAYRYVPRTYWEKRIETVQVPVSTRRLVPETRTVRRPVAGFRTVQREVVSRVAVRGPSRPAPAETPVLAQRDQIGGISRLDTDPPRYGAATAWRASSSIRR